jgi:hypothetical protein
VFKDGPFLTVVALVDRFNGPVEVKINEIVGK